MNAQGYSASNDSAAQVQSVLVQPVPGHYKAARLSREPGANRALVDHLRRTGLDCAMHRDGIVVYRRNAVEFAYPGQVIVYNEDKLEVLPDQDFERRYQPLAA